jgi:hypothetical protein
MPTGGTLAYRAVIVMTPDPPEFGLSVAANTKLTPKSMAIPAINHFDMGYLSIDEFDPLFNNSFNNSYYRMQVQETRDTPLSDTSVQDAQNARYTP